MITYSRVSKRPSHMAAMESPLQAVNPSEPLKLPHSLYDEFRRKMQEWQANLRHDPFGDQLPAILQCFREEPKAAFHFFSFALILRNWWEGPCRELFDGLNWVREEGSKITVLQERWMQAIERDFRDSGKLSWTCVMNMRSLKRAVYGHDDFVPGSLKTTPDCLVNHLFSRDEFTKEYRIKVAEDIS